MLGDLHTEQQCRHHGLQCGMGVRVVDAVDGAQVGLVMCGHRSQGLQVVAHDFGGDILNHGLLRQSGDVLQVEAVLEPLEGFLNAPAFLVQVAKGAGREALGVEQIGHQHAHFAIRREVEHQADLLGMALRDSLARAWANACSVTVRSHWARPARWPKNVSSSA